MAPKAGVLFNVHRFDVNAKLAYENAMKEHLKTWMPKRDGPAFKFTEDYMFDLLPSQRDEDYFYY